MKLTIIANPHAGGGAGKEQLEYLLNACQIHNIHPTVYQTSYAGELAVLIQQALPHLTTDEKLVIVGGDGTLNEAIAALKENAHTLPIAYLPAGTGNDFAREMHFTKDAAQFLSLLETTTTREIELLCYQEHNTSQKGVALNSLGFGIDAEICQLNTVATKSTKRKWGFNQLSYLTPLIHAFQQHQNFTVQLAVNGQAVQTYDQNLLVGFFNHSYFGGGIRFVPQAHQNSHSFEAVVARDVSGWTILKALPLIFLNGSHFETFPQKLIRKTGTTAHIQIDQPILMQTDGEVHSFEQVSLTVSLDSYPVWITE